jgi:hypothetical protein
MQIKMTRNSTLHQSEWLRSKNSADADKDVEKEEHSSTVGGIPSLYNHSGSQSAGSLENCIYYYRMIQQYLFWAYVQKMSQPV